MAEYEVFLSDEATRLLDLGYQWYYAESKQTASKWYNGFLDAINGLAKNPYQHGLARENDAFPVELRELLYGVGRRTTHRALYVIRPGKVVVYSIRHVAQRDVTPEDF